MSDDSKLTVEERFAKERCARFILDMIIKYGPEVQAKRENKCCDLEQKENQNN